MAKTRVYELAKELKVTNKDLIDTMARLGIYTRSHMSVLENGEVIKVRNHYRQQWRAAKLARMKREQAGVKPEQADNAARVPATTQQEEPPVRQETAPEAAQAAPEAGAAGRQDTGRATAPLQPAATAGPGAGQTEGPGPVTTSETRGQAQEASTPKESRSRQQEQHQPRQQRHQGQQQQEQPRHRDNRGYNQRQPAGREPQAQAGRPQHPQAGEAVQRQRPQGGESGRGQQQWRDKRRRGEGPHRQEENRGPSRETPAARADTKGQGAGQRPAADRGQRRPGPAYNKPLRIPKPPEAVTKDLPEKRRDRPNAKPATKPEAGRSRKKELEHQREERLLRRDRNKGKAQKHKETPKVVFKITLTGSITVQELAKRIGKTAAEVIKYLMGQGIMATINQELDIDTAALAAQDLGAVVEIKHEKPLTELEDLVDPPETLRERPPVVTVMGHVDHGKTSLLDAIRRTNVTASEAGGITQHIGAYQVRLKNRKITFLDTPGHAAFTAMRARGAQATDIAILVVAADDGVMPQTIEAINHAKAAGVPIVVAINKIDRPDANPDRVKQQLTEYGLVPEEWGGETIMVPVSAVTKQGLNELLEMVLLTADVAELKANPDRPARGIVIEAQLDRGRGPVATMLVQKGTLKVGDNLVAGAASGRVRAMVDDRGERVNSAPPSTPVEVLGLSELPEAGDIFQVVEDEKLARQIATSRQEEKRQEEMQVAGKTSLDDLFKQMEAGEVKELNLVIKGDVQGSVEALRSALEQLSTSEVKVNLLHGGVGAITETDVMLAAASRAIIIGFNVRPEANVRKAAEEAGVEIRLYRVIYEVVDDVRAAMSGLLEPEQREATLGRAEVRATFKVPKAGTVAGCLVTEGKLQNHALARVIRDGVVVFEGRIDSLKRFKDDAREVAQGYECGVGLEKFNDIKEGDVIEAYTIEEIKREL
ncbi:translation initiation factor IF-2 [Moorella sp. Hama-1]|uniref:translation initiation factor IF-2 n=1 Tax=Moorella sp. Hama-1 TaxID=2138101 RepID=UPI000D64E7B7|nr:translation initiation factor IF-2 [Moorella sp. Hama-1]MDN5361606.1 translation initiation factor [Moorella sp. (in: firmicutes)]BCV21134.1 translation initiation factor IF-2 [Moorella sp. Hama-1]